MVILFPGVAFGGLYDYDPEFNAWLLLSPVRLIWDCRNGIHPVATIGKQEAP